MMPALHVRWEHSSVGRASALQAEGHRFEPCCSHHPGPVVQLVRTLACHARGRGFESHPGRHYLKAKYYEPLCGFSSFGRARPCQGRGGGFEPRNPLQQKGTPPQPWGRSFFLLRLTGAKNPRGFSKGNPRRGKFCLRQNLAFRRKAKMTSNEFACGE